MGRCLGAWDITRGCSLFHFIIPPDSVCLRSSGGGNVYFFVAGQAEGQRDEARRGHYISADGECRQPIGSGRGSVPYLHHQSLGYLDRIRLLPIPMKLPVIRLYIRTSYNTHPDPQVSFFGPAHDTGDLGTWACTWLPTLGYLRVRCWPGPARQVHAIEHQAPGTRTFARGPCVLVFTPTPEAGDADALQAAGCTGRVFYRLSRCT